MAVAVVAMAGSLTSCKKEYTCTCTTSGAGVSGSTSTTATMSKKDAEEWCGGSSASSTAGTTTISTTCELE